VGRVLDEEILVAWKHCNTTCYSSLLGTKWRLYPKVQKRRRKKERNQTNKKKSSV